LGQKRADAIARGLGLDKSKCFSETQFLKFVPGGYIDTWCRANGAEVSIVMLYKSAFTTQIVYGGKAQQSAGAAELFPYRKGHHRVIVGASVVPPLWEVNFCLIYMLNPKLAANMPAYFAPIPKSVAAALKASPTGQVPYSDFASDFDQ